MSMIILVMYTSTSTITLLCTRPAKNLLWFTTVNLLCFTTVKRSVFAEYLLRFTIVNTMVYHSIYYGLLQ